MSKQNTGYESDEPIPTCTLAGPYLGVFSLGIGQVRVQNRRLASHSTASSRAQVPPALGRNCEHHRDQEKAPVGAVSGDENVQDVQSQRGQASTDYTDQ